MAIFKAYDIRGVYPTELDEKIVFGIGNALSMWKPKRVVLGYDMRASSPSLVKAAIEGMVKAGIDVINVGLCSTPMFYYATHHFDVDRGMMITASHNPAKFNGVKLCKTNAHPVTFETGIGKVKDFVESGQEFDIESDPDPMKVKGTVEDFDNFLGIYIDFMKKFLNVKRPLKVVVDAANGMGGMTAPNVLEDAVELTSMYCELDG